MKNLLITLLSAVACLTVFCACSNSNEKPVPARSAAPKLDTIVAQPELALSEIYKNIDIKGIESADDTIMKEKFFFDLSYVDDYWVSYSSKNYGVSDVFIIKPTDDGFDKVEETLADVKKSRIAEFTDYNVYNSLEISQNSLVYSFGDYVIMLMLEDNTVAKEIISQYIPS